MTVKKKKQGSIQQGHKSSTGTNSHSKSTGRIKFKTKTQRRWRESGFIFAYSIFEIWVRLWFAGADNRYVCYTLKCALVYCCCRVNLAVAFITQSKSIGLIHMCVLCWRAQCLNNRSIKKDLTNYTLLSYSRELRHFPEVRQFMLSYTINVEYCAYQFLENTKQTDHIYIETGTIDQRNWPGRWWCFVLATTCPRMFENERFFSHLSALERELSFRTEMVGFFPF